MPALDRPSEARTIQQLIADSLRLAIAEGRLVAGQRLRQDEIAAEFGVSHIPVREAFRELEGQGLVSVLPRRGAVVTSLTPDEIEEVVEMRALLECALLRHAIPHIDDRVLAQAESVIDAIDRERDNEHWSALNWQFHATLYRAAGRPRLFAAIEALHANVGRYLRVEESVLHNRTDSQEEHRRLLRLIRRRRAGEAAKLLAQHITGPGANLVARLRRGASLKDGTSC